MKQVKSTHAFVVGCDIHQDNIHWTCEMDIYSENKNGYIWINDVGCNNHIGTTIFQKSDDDNPTQAQVSSNNWKTTKTLIFVGHSSNNAAMQ